MMWTAIIAGWLCVIANGVWLILEFAVIVSNTTLDLPSKRTMKLDAWIHLASFVLLVIFVGISTITQIRSH